MESTVGGLARAFRSGLLQGCEMTEGDLIVFMVLCRSSILSLFFFFPSALPLPACLLFHKYVLSTYCALGLILGLGSVAILMNKTGYIILTIEWRD